MGGGIQGWEDFLHQETCGWGSWEASGPLLIVPWMSVWAAPSGDAESPAALCTDCAVEPSPGLFALVARMLKAHLSPSALAFLGHDLPGGVPLPSGLAVLSWAGFRVLG